MSMSTDITKSAPNQDADRLAGLASEVLRLAAARGASQAEVSISEDSGLVGKRAHGRGRNRRAHP